MAKYIVYDDGNSKKTYSLRQWREKLATAEPTEAENMQSKSYVIFKCSGDEIEG